MTSTPEIRRAAGSLIIGGIHGLDLPEADRRRLKTNELGGIILFKRNLETLEQAVSLTEAIHRAAPEASPPLLVSVDQEGGPVARLRGMITDFPAMRALGAICDPQLAASVGEVVGAELAALGINLNFAPVMDVDTNPRNPVIAERAFSADAQQVAHLAGAFATGMLLHHVLPCAKHFPGHGDTVVDSHFDLPVVRHKIDRLLDTELVPFSAAVRARLPLIMSAHVVVPELDERHPATLSAAVLTDLLRATLGFQGVIVSDDLEMKAIADRYSIEEVVTLGVEAGLDLFLICHSEDKQREAFETLVRLAESSSRERDRILDAARRVVRMRRDYLVKWTRDDAHWRDVITCESHLELARRVHESQVKGGAGAGTRD